MGQWVCDHCNDGNSISLASIKCPICGKLKPEFKWYYDQVRKTNKLKVKERKIEDRICKKK